MSDEPLSFVRAIEVWRPDGNLLQRDSGAYGQLSAFEDASMMLTLRKGQGLPGAVWDTMRPEVWHNLGSAFVRSEPARVGGIGAAVAIPFFHGAELVAIVAFYCGSADASEGCIEVWEPDGRGALEHADGYYGALAEFERVSRDCTFARGQGLPGLVLQEGTPQIVDDLREASAFVRRDAARENGVASGLGFPIYAGGRIAQVVLLLSAESTPLARAFEVWEPRDDGHLVCVQSFYAPGLEVFAAARRTMICAPGEDLVGRVADSGLPFAVGTESRAFAQLELARAHQLTLVLALPIDDGQGVRAVVTLFS